MARDTEFRNIVDEASRTGNAWLSSIEQSASSGYYNIAGSVGDPTSSLANVIGNSGMLLWVDLVNLVSSVSNVRLPDFPNFISLNYAYMNRLMLINDIQRSALLAHQGMDAEKNFGDITPDAYVPYYARHMSYLPHAINVYRNEYDNIDTPRVIEAPNNRHPYQEEKPAFYDERSIGQDKQNSQDDFGDKIQIKDQQSTVYKTKRLFAEKKIKTIISAFATGTDGSEDHGYFEGSNATQFGLSHGNNLLTRQAETGGGTYKINGYENPYCRVWTHHHQYKRFNNMIRPFVSENNGVVEEVNSPQKFHDWSGEGKNKEWMVFPGIQYEKGFENKQGAYKPKDFQFGWKSMSNDGWSRSVLNKDTGLLNIAPSYNFGGSSTNIHPKDVMFSIENLAWKDYNPYTFEKTLSWEQRGPMGGRIMWFPPYGLSFNETARAEWTANSFIGRGEDVFTYNKSQRTGTLRFILVTDHPSILDYTTWSQNNVDEHIKDTDIRRFIAGCEVGKYTGTDKNYSLVNYAKPTPLTDEFLSEVNQELTEENVPKPKKEKEPDVDDGTTTKISFYVFYPNNYSGVDDDSDFAIGYLLGGRNAQKTTTLNDTKTAVLNSSNIPISYKQFVVNGNGYEINNVGITDLNESDFIYGKKLKNGGKDAWPADGGGKFAPSLNESMRWYYRIDGSYTPPAKATKSNTYKGKTLSKKWNPNVLTNTYDQYLAKKQTDGSYAPDRDSYRNTNSSKLNSDLINLPSEFKQDGEELYTFTEVAQAVAQVKGSEKGTDYQGIKTYLEGITSPDAEKYQKLIDLLSKGEVTNIETVGYSSAHGNKDINVALAINRGITITNWLKTTMEWNNVQTKHDSAPSKGQSTANSDQLAAKIYRSAKCTITFKMSETKPVEESQTVDEYVVDAVTFSKTNEKHEDKTVYLDKKNQKWVDMGDKMVKLEYVQSPEVARAYSNDGKSYDQTDDNGNKSLGEYNKYRYDQEYHFFKQMQIEDEITWEKFTKKLQYFNPVFHAMTPEGFTTRLTFLQQCTRQGDTISMSDTHGQTASNMAFGRPPFCVLRIGDFYNQMIVINNVNFNYDVSGGIVWDLNTEGAGVQPMLCEVSIDFTFIGGGSLEGPIRRLQNACSFNYYSNSQLFDNRADRVKYNVNPEMTSGFGELDKKNSYYHNIHKGDLDEQLLR